MNTPATVRTIIGVGTVAALRRALQGLDGDLPVHVSIAVNEVVNGMPVTATVSARACAVMVGAMADEDRPAGVVVVAGE